VSKEKAVEILETLLRLDKRDVEDFQSQYAWGGMPPMEERLRLLEYRFKHFAGDVIAAIRELTKDEQPQPGVDQR
jgi:hypothetical protein